MIGKSSLQRAFFKDDSSKCSLSNKQFKNTITRIIGFQIPSEKQVILKYCHWIKEFVQISCFKVLVQKNRHSNEQFPNTVIERSTSQVLCKCHVSNNQFPNTILQTSSLKNTIIGRDSFQITSSLEQVVSIYRHSKKYFPNTVNKTTNF